MISFHEHAMNRVRLCLLCFFALVIFIATVSSALAQQLAVRGETVYTMAGPAIRDGVVLIRDGKIERVGPASGVQIPANYRTINARVVTPGLIDAHSVIGLAGYLNQPHDQMQLERSAAIQPELRAVDAYNGRERLIEWVRGFGVTTLHTGHGPGSLISGQTMIVKTITGEVEQALVIPAAMIAASVGDAGLATGGRAPGTYAKEIAMLRTELIKAQEYDRKQQSAKEDQKGARDLRTEALVRVLKGELPLLVTVQRAHNIISVLRLAKEFNLRVILDGAAEAYMIAEQIKAAGVPVIIHPTMTRAAGETENLSMETAATLRKAGIAIALQSGFEGYVPKTRVVLFEAAVAASNGLSFDEALATITIDAARMLGINNRVGSLETGKDADLALYDGDPFEYTTHCTGTIINGRVVSEEAH
ncbi:MAG TPA: amidohydrolase family protein [Pyrinomonadaceae bacterium]|jgi:imidazolonepropionase-like amidohydrolase|nr:amidohydrolase family protein [Pyrinomonadaceae bacterium]